MFCEESGGMDFSNARTRYPGLVWIRILFPLSLFDTPAGLRLYLWLQWLRHTDGGGHERESLETPDPRSMRIADKLCRISCGWRLIPANSGATSAAAMFSRQARLLEPAGNLKHARGKKFRDQFGR
jgi:hypothetical protein